MKYSFPGLFTMSLLITTSGFSDLFMWLFMISSFCDPDSVTFQPCKSWHMDLVTYSSCLCKLWHPDFMTHLLSLKIMKSGFCDLLSMSIMIFRFSEMFVMPLSIMALWFHNLFMISMSGLLRPTNMLIALRRFTNF